MDRENGVDSGLSEQEEEEIESEVTDLVRHPLAL